MFTSAQHKLAATCGLLVRCRISLSERDAMDRGEGVKVRLRWSGRQLFAVLLLSIAVTTGFGSADASARAAKPTPRSRTLAALLRDHTLVALHRHRAGRARAHASIVGGTLTMAEQVPWQVAIFAKFEYEEEEWQLLCGGSIVRDMRHVLTAGALRLQPIHRGTSGDERLHSVSPAPRRFPKNGIPEGPTVQARTVERGSSASWLQRPRWRRHSRRRRRARTRKPA